MCKMYYLKPKAALFHISVMTKFSVEVIEGFGISIARNLILPLNLTRNSYFLLLLILFSVSSIINLYYMDIHHGCHQLSNEFNKSCPGAKSLHIYECQLNDLFISLENLVISS